MQYFQVLRSKRKKGAGEDESPLNAAFLLLYIAVLIKYSGHFKNSRKLDSNMKGFTIGMAD